MVETVIHGAIMDWKEVIGLADRSAVLALAGKFFAGLFGSLVSLRFVQGTVWQKFNMLISGALFSWYGTSVAVHYWGEEVEHVAAFFIGLFGMSVASKLYETVQAVPAAELAATVTSFFRSRSKGE